MLAEVAGGLCESACAVAEGVFDLGGQLAKSTFVAVGDEERVVAKAAGAARGACDAAFAGALEGVERSGRRVGDGDDADEARAARTPGAPPSASTTRPESSESVNSPLCAE